MKVAIIIRQLICYSVRLTGALPFVHWYQTVKNLSAVAALAHPVTINAQDPYSCAEFADTVNYFDQIVSLISSLLSIICAIIFIVSFVRLITKLYTGLINTVISQFGFTPKLSDDTSSKRNDPGVHVYQTFLNVNSRPIINPTPTSTSVGKSKHKELETLDTLKSSYQTDPFFQQFYNQSELPTRYTFQDGFLYYDKKLCIPHASLQHLLDSNHKSQLGGHIGSRRLQKKLRPHFYFPNFNTVIKNYVDSCQTCHKTNANHSKKPGFLELPPIPQERWEHISLDFITGLPSVSHPTYPQHEFDALLTIVDKLTCRVHFVPTITTLNSVQLLDLLIYNVFRLHGFPKIIQSDCCPQFDINLYKEYLESLGCKLQLGTAYRQQSNGKSERYNELVEIYLHCYIQQNSDWVHFLPFAEYTINSSPHKSLNGMSPFEADLGFLPNHPIHLPFPILPKATAFKHQLSQNLDAAKLALAESQQKYKQYYDKKHLYIQYDVGDEVYIDRNILTTLPDAQMNAFSPKLSGKFVGPFTIVNKDSALNYTLELPPSSKIHPIFHISQLRLAKNIPKSTSHIKKDVVPFGKYKDGSEESEINQICAHRKRGKGIQLLIEFADNTTEWIAANKIKRSTRRLYDEYVSTHHL